MTTPPYEAFSFEETSTAVLGSDGNGFVLKSDGFIASSIKKMSLLDYIDEHCSSGNDKDDKYNREDILKLYREGKIRQITIPKQGTYIIFEEPITFPTTKFVDACDEFRRMEHTLPEYDSVYPHIRAMAYIHLNEEIATRHGLSDGISVMSLDVDDGLLQGLKTYLHYTKNIASLPITEIQPMSPQKRGDKNSQGDGRTIDDGEST